MENNLIITDKQYEMLIMNTINKKALYNISWRNRNAIMLLTTLDA